jgi:hypothetical protein
VANPNKISSGKKVLCKGGQGGGNFRLDQGQLVFIAEQTHHRVRQARPAQREFLIDDVDGKALNFGLARLLEHRRNRKARNKRHLRVGNARADGDEAVHQAGDQPMRCRGT